MTQTNATRPPTISTDEPTNRLPNPPPGTARGRHPRDGGGPAGRDVPADPPGRPRDGSGYGGTRRHRTPSGVIESNDDRFCRSLFTRFFSLRVPVLGASPVESAQSDLDLTPRVRSRDVVGRRVPRRRFRGPPVGVGQPESLRRPGQRRIAGHFESRRVFVRANPLAFSTQRCLLCRRTEWNCR